MPETFDPALLEPEPQADDFDPSLLAPEEEAEQQEILQRPGLPAWDFGEMGTLREPTTWEQFRHSGLARKLLGPTSDEMALQSPDSSLTPGGEIGLIPAAQKVLEMTSVPPQVSGPIREYTDPLLAKLPPVPQGIAKGARELALTVPIAPLGEGAAGTAALGAFGAEYAANLPAQKRAYEEALARGDKVEASKIATETVLGGGLLGAGAYHTGKGKPTERSANAGTIREAEEVLPTVQEQPVEGAKEMPASKGGERVSELPEAAQGKVSLGPVKLRDEVAAMSPDEFRDWSTRQPNGFTATAYELGRSAPSQEFVDSLKAKSDEIYAQAEELMKADSMEAMETIPVLAAKGQFFKEAWQYATGQGSGGEAALKAGHVPIWSHLPTGELPLAAYKGEVPEKAVPIKVRREDGSVYEAFRESEGDATIPPMISKIKPSGEQGVPSRSHKPLGKGEEIIEGPKTRNEYRTTVAQKAKSAKGVSETNIGISAEASGGSGNEVDGGIQPRSLKPLSANEEIIKEQQGEAEAGTKPAPSPAQVSQSPLPVPAQTLGITSPGAAALGKAGLKAIGKLNRIRQAFGTLFKARDNRAEMDQTFDAADNLAVNAGEQARNKLRIGTSPLERQAALAVIEAQGDPAKLNQFLAQAVAGRNQPAIDAVRYAQANWTRLQALSRRAENVFDSQIADEQSNGINTEFREGYVPHLYDMDLLMGKGKPFVIGGGKGISTGFKKGRTFDTIFEAIEAGYTPRSLDVADLAEHRVKVGQKLINRQHWADDLRTINDPTDGRPLVTDLQTKQRGPGGGFYQVAPMGYVTKEIIPGVRIAVHEGYSSLFDALTGTSRISGSVPGKVLLETAGAVKHGLLAFDTFHASRIAQKQLFLTGKLGYKKGLSLLEYADSDLTRAVSDGLITTEMADWARTNRPDADLLLKSGLNVGRIQEGLYNSFIREIPVLGTFNKWVFEKMTRGAMLEAGLIELARRSKSTGVSKADAAKVVARELNAYFGNLGRQGLFKSQTAQDLARLVALAPQWVESMARTEVKGAFQTAKGLTYDPVVHKSILVGSLGKGVAQGLMAYFIGTQLLNLVTRGKSTWDNPEEGHKLDAWIPDLSGKGGHGFFISPFSVVAELTHDMIRYSHTEPSTLEAASRIASNKASPLFRAGKVLLTGQDYNRQQINGTWNRVKAAAWAVAPTPIPLQPLIKGTSYPGQTQRQLTASLGFKTEPAPSPSQQIREKARAHMEALGKKPSADFQATDEPSYDKLRGALRLDDPKAAQEVLDGLLKTHSRKQVWQAMQNHLKRPFTGSQTEETKFRKQLSPEEKALYQKARAEQRDEYQQFLKLWFKK